MPSGHAAYGLAKCQFNMSNLWFYALDGTQHGPMPTEELQALLGTKLPKSTLVWSEGMESWVAAEKVEELVGLVAHPPQPRLVVQPRVPQPVVEAEGYGGSSSARANPAQRNSPPATSYNDSLVRGRQAWARFFARSIDVTLFYVLCITLLGGEIIGGNMATLFMQVMMLCMIFIPVMMLCMIPVEAWCLSRWGLTPGKWVFRVRVVHQDNRYLTFEEAIRRTLKVTISGMALGFLLLQTLFNVLAYKEFVATGTTSWDRKYHSVVQFGARTSMHTGIAILMVVLFMLWLNTMNSAAGAL